MPTPATQPGAAAITRFPPRRSAGLLLLAFSFAIYPASWLFSYYYQSTAAGCFSDVCNHANPGAQKTTRNNLLAFYVLLIFTAVVASASRLVAPIHRLLSLRIVSAHSTVTFGEIAWFSVAAFVVLFVCSAANWADSFAGEMRGNRPWTQGIFALFTNLSGDSLSVAFGLVLLPASKYSAVNDFLGLPYTSTARIHTWLAYLALWTLVSHIVFASIAQTFNGNVLQTFFSVRSPRNPDAAGWGNRRYLYITGVVAFFAFVYVALTSLKIVRRRNYNLFYYSHFMIIVVLLFGYFHASMSIFYCIPGIALWTIDGILRLASRFKHNAILSLEKEPGGFRTMTIATSRGVDCQPGQFIRICVPAVSIAEYHPLSVVRATPESVTVMFAPDKESQWTARIAKHVEERLAAGGMMPRAQVQGPFGSVSRLATDPSLHSLVAYVAGTGAAPGFAILRSAVRDAPAATAIGESDAVLVGAKKESANDANTHALYESRAGPRLYLFWAAAGAGLELASEVVDLARAVAASDATLTLHVFDTSDPGSERGVTVAGELNELPGVTVHASRARPHLLALLNRHVREPAAAAASDRGHVAPVGIFICGPDRFIEESLSSVSKFQRENRGIPVELEVESYGL
ncbi:hypothetical protein HK405_002191 [Cladochytrium tenue]|nr:hypothetical protein HK405_002191 [Cladochytrium tenue]